MLNDGYQHRMHNRNLLLVHLVLVTKHRKPILVEGFRMDVMRYIFDACVRHHRYIRRMETDRDHVHILLQYAPTDSVTAVVSVIKQLSTWKASEYMEGVEGIRFFPVAALLARVYAVVKWVLCCLRRDCFRLRNRTIHRNPGVSKTAPKGAWLQPNKNFVKSNGHSVSSSGVLT